MAIAVVEFDIDEGIWSINLGQKVDIIVPDIGLNS